MSKLVGTGVLAGDTGESARTLQHWSDLGILRPVAETNKKGRGYYRQFPAGTPFQGERMWAVIASALNKLRIPLGDIKQIIERFRLFVRSDHDVEPAIGWEKAMMATPFGRALLGRFEVIMVTLGDDNTAGWSSIMSTPSIEAVKSATMWPKEFTGWDADYEQVAKLKIEAPWEFLALHSACYVLNLTKILAPLRKEP